MTRDFRRAWTANFSVGMALRSRATRPRKTWPVAVRYRPQSPGQRGSGIREIGPAKFPGCLFFEFMKARERCRAAWNLSRLICQPLRQIDVIIAHNVEPRFFGKLPMVFGEHAVQLGDLFMDIKAFCNHLLYSTRCRQPLGFRGSPPFRISDSVRVGSLSKNARLLQRSSSLGTLRHVAGLIERRLRFCVQIKFWPLVFSHGEKLRHRASPLSIRSSTLLTTQIVIIPRFAGSTVEPAGIGSREAN